MLSGKVRAIDDNGEFKLIAQGNTAEVYLYGDNKILKLFRENLPVEAIKSEYERVRIIQGRLQNIPQAYEIVEYRGRRGIVYEKITGADMIKIMLKNPFGVKRCSKELAYIHFELHKTSPDLDFSVKEKLASDIDAAEILSREEKERIKRYLQKLPEGKALLHFDFHPGNIIMRGNRPFIIDWMTACTGAPGADVARSFLLLKYGELSHAGRFVNSLAGILKRYIGKIYIEEYKRLSGISNADYERWILPAAAGRLMEWISDNEKEQLLKLIKNELHKFESEQ